MLTQSLDLQSMEVGDEVRGLERPQAERSEDTANAVCGKETVVANDGGQQHPDVVLDIEQHSKNEDETRTQSWQTLSELLDRLIVALTPGYSKTRDHEEESSRNIDDVIEITTAITELNEPNLSEESKKANTERLVMEKGEILPLISAFMKQLYSSKCECFAYPIVEIERGSSDVIGRQFWVIYTVA